MRNRSLLPLIILTYLMTGQVFGAEKVITTEAIGKGRTLVFVPGLACPGEVWQEVVNQLSGKYRCVRVSIGGFAGSAAPPSFETDVLVQAVGDVLLAEKKNHPILIGHSFGGFIALQVAARYPDRVTGLVVVDAYPFPMGAMQPGVSPEQARAQAQQVAQLFQQLPEPAFRAQQVASQAQSARDESRQKQIVDWICQTDRTIYFKGLAAMLGGDVRDLLPRITAPVLVVGTWQSGQSLGWNRDNTAQRFSEQYKGLTQVQILVHETAHHFIMFDDPTGLTKTIGEFAHDNV